MPSRIAGVAVSLALLAFCALLIGWLRAGGARGAATAPGPARGEESPAVSPAELSGGSGPSVAERRAEHPVAEDRPSPVSALRGASYGFEPEAPTDVEGCALRLRVTNAIDGAPLAGFQVVLGDRTCPIGPFTYATDAAGEITTPAAYPPGAVALAHVPDRSGGPYPDPWELEPRVAMVAEEAGSEVALEVRAEPPSQVVFVDALRADGRPLVGQEVYLIEGAIDESGQSSWEYWRDAITGDDGRARFVVHGELSGKPFATLVAHPFEGEVCDALLIDPPLGSGPYRLRLYAGGELTVRVVDGVGAPTSGVLVSVRFRHRVRQRVADRKAVDEYGAARFAPLPAGTYAVAVRATASGLPLVEGDVELPAGESVERVLRLDDEGAPRVLVRGRVLDPDGSPAGRRVTLAAQLDDRGPRRLIHTREDGTFELRGPGSCEWVTVSSQATVYTEPMEPAVMRVPAGAGEVVFRRLGDGERRTVVFRVVDDATGEPIPDELDAALVLFLEPPEGERVLGPAYFGLTQGVAEADFSAQPRMRWKVLAPGYQEASGVLEAPASTSERPVIEVRLDAGFRRRLVVYDARSREPLSGVAVREGPTRHGSTGVGGDFELVAGDRPERITFEREGYGVLEWDPAAHWFHWRGEFWLEPLGAGPPAER